MELKELRELPGDELRSEIQKAREKVFRMRFKGKGKDLESPGEYKALRKSIARIFTLLRERELKSTARVPPRARPASEKVASGAIRPTGGEA
jgi:large subunit ribosomal protein L29